MGGNPIQSIGCAKINFEIHKQKFNYLFMLVPDDFYGSQIDGLLGASFLEENKVIIKGKVPLCDK